MNDWNKIDRISEKVVEEWREKKYRGQNCNYGCRCGSPSACFCPSGWVVWTPVSGNVEDFLNYKGGFGEKASLHLPVDGIESVDSDFWSRAKGRIGGMIAHEFCHEGQKAKGKLPSNARTDFTPSGPDDYVHYYALWYEREAHAHQIAYEASRNATPIADTETVQRIRRRVHGAKDQECAEEYIREIMRQSEIITNGYT